MTNYSTEKKVQDKVRLYFSDEDVDLSEVKQYVKDYLEGNDVAPSGATILEHQALWKGSFEPGIVIEIWVDGAEELEAVRGLRDGLQEMHKQDCVCLERLQSTFEHRKED